MNCKMTEKSAEKYAFISQPMAGKTTERIKWERAQYLDELEARGYVVLDTVFEDYATANVKHKEPFYLGRALERLAHADKAFFLPGWQESRGCQIEHLVAERYGIPIEEMKPIVG